MSLRIKKNDKVEVITGKYKGTVSRVIGVRPDDNRAVVENVNMMKRHTKARSAQQPGGIIEREATIHMSNLQLYCDSCKRGVRFGTKVSDDGARSRVCKKCGGAL
jgi:large subunit ribosomal protein L24